MSGFSFAVAKRENEPIRLGIAGPSRSGKTKSALRVARGMVGGDMSKVFAVNTERGGLSLYADEFPGFMMGTLEPPYSFAAYKAAIKAAVSAGALAVVIDSTSHLHEGDGGYLAMHEAELQRMAGDDYKRREAMKFTAWIKPAAERKDFVLFMMALNVHTIWCFRSREKLKLVRQSNGKIEPMPQGYQPIITEGFEFEVHSLISLGENSKGVPDLNAQAMGLRDPVDGLLRAKPGQPLDEDFGHKLATWAMGKKPAGSAPVAVSPAPAPTAAPEPPPATTAPETTAEVPFDDETGASPPPPSAAEWAWISADGTKHPIASGQEWMTRVAGMVAKMPDAETVKAARTRNAPVFKALTMAGELDAIAHISQIISDRIGELEGGK